jgi:hypothetical protein
MADGVSYLVSDSADHDGFVMVTVLLAGINNSVAVKPYNKRKEVVFINEVNT